MSGWFGRRPGAGAGHQRNSADERLWRALFGASEALAPLDAGERARLRRLADEFLATRRFESAGGLELDPSMCVRVAAEACLPILELGLDWYRDARTVRLYPAGFLVEQSWTDEAGVVHDREAELAGEAWEGGPVILAWEDVADPEPGVNVVVHEFAHVLDALNGRINGFPPVGDATASRAWSSAFTAAYADHVERVERDAEPFVDPYGAEDEGEFFAVVTETFFTWPENVAEGYPDVHDALCRFFRQDPLARLERGGGG